MSLHPEHLADLRKSGLSDEMIEKAGIRSVPPGEINKLLGWNAPVNSVLAFPYPGDNSFIRHKLFPALLRKGETRAQKYYQSKNSDLHIYRPPGFDPDADIYIVEGEKKTLKGQQEGLNCLGISGLWNWKVKGEEALIEDFNKYNFKGKQVFLVPDNDWQDPEKNLVQAVYRLAYLLDERGATVSIIQLPEGSGKVGLDDYLIEHSVAEFHALPVIPVKSLKERVAEATPENYKNVLPEMKRVEDPIEKAILCKNMAKRLGVSPSIIQKEIKPTHPEKAAKNAQPVYSAKFDGLIDLVDQDGQPAFLMMNDNGLIVTREAVLDGTVYIPPPIGKGRKIPFLLPRADEVMKAWKTDNDATLYADLLVYFKEASELPGEGYYHLLTAWVFHTYLIEKFDYSPEMCFYSALAEKGKTRTASAMTYVAFKGEVIESLREAYIFRSSEQFGGSLFFDCMDIWKKAEKNQSEDILLSRYERGKQVPRVLYPEKGAFEDTVYYDIFGPTIIATNMPIHKILETRAIQIVMQKSFRNFENAITREASLPLKERLVAFRAKHINKELPEMSKAFKGRFGDITKPLLQVMEITAPQYKDDLLSLLEQIHDEKTESKRDTFEYRILQAILDLEDEVEQGFLPTKRITEKLNEDIPEKWQVGTRSVGRKLKGLGFANTTRSSGSIRGFEIGCKVMLRLLSEYDEKKMRKHIQNKCNLCNQRNLCSVFKELNGYIISDVLSEGNKRNCLSTKNNREKDVSYVSDVFPECIQEEKKEEVCDYVEL